MKTANKVIRFNKFHKCEYSVRKTTFNVYRVDFVIFCSDTTYSSVFYVHDKSDIYSVLKDYYNGVINITY